MKRRTLTWLAGSIAAIAAQAGVPVVGQSSPDQGVEQAGKTQSRKPGATATPSPDERARRLVAAMTREEKLVLVRGFLAPFDKVAGARQGSAGYVPGIPRLGLPAQWQTDAGVGVATLRDNIGVRERTALPSGLATAATWNPDLARRAGAMIGKEARESGFNVMLAGGVNLTREPRNGRNFEYGGEDPLLAGVIVGSQIAGIQSNNIISTIKHFAMNDQETARTWGSSNIAEKAMRESDLLAFQFAFEIGDPGSVMCAYNKVNTVYACENPFLLRQVLRQEWGWKGYVMSDWGATHSTAPSVRAGLDQQSGWPSDAKPFYGEELTAALASGEVTPAELDTMATRIVRTMFAHGLVDDPVTSAAQHLSAGMLAEHAAITRVGAEEAIVLLKNDNILPLSPAAKTIVVIGGHADRGVLAGGGSSLVFPVGGNALPIGFNAWPAPIMYYPNAPLAEIRRLSPGANVTFVPGNNVAEAQAAARNADVVVLFATQWTFESSDTSLTLPDNQDGLIDAVASANPRTVVVLETGGPVLTPWAGKVAGIVEAWYPGTQGGTAIANVLTGRVNPSGHLPMTFPASIDQLPNPGPLTNDVDYKEGAAVGYKWYDAKGFTPAFAFGHGLSYTRFALTGLKAQAGQGGIAVSFQARNIGAVGGKTVAQVYVAGDGWEAPRRLGAFRKVDLAPGASTRIQAVIDPRLLATWDEAGKRWQVKAGTYRVSLAASAADEREVVSVKVPARTFPNTLMPVARRPE